MPFLMDAGRFPTDTGIRSTACLPKGPRLVGLLPPDTGPATDGAGDHQLTAEATTEQQLQLCDCVH